MRYIANSCILGLRRTASCRDREEGANRVRGIPGGVETSANPAPTKAQTPPQRRIGPGRSRVGARYLSLAPSPGKRRHHQPNRDSRREPSRRQPRHPQPLVPRHPQPRPRHPTAPCLGHRQTCPKYRPTPRPKARITRAPSRRRSRRISTHTITTWPPRPFPARASRQQPLTASHRQLVAAAQHPRPTATGRGPRAGNSQPSQVGIGSPRHPPATTNRQPATITTTHQQPRPAATGRRPRAGNSQPSQVGSPRHPANNH